MSVSGGGAVYEGVTCWVRVCLHVCVHLHVCMTGDCDACGCMSMCSWLGQVLAQVPELCVVPVCHHI